MRLGARGSALSLAQAEQVARALGQREILVLWDLPRSRHRVSSASPKGAPQPGAEARFCDWVRRHSRRARTNPKDPCYRRRGRG